MGRVGNNYGMDSPRVSRDLTLRNLKHMNLLVIFSIFPWGSKKSHMSFYNSYTINFVTILIRSALKNECHWQKFQNIFQEIIKRNQPNRFQTRFFAEIWVSKNPGFVSGSPPRGFIFPEMTPKKKWKCQKTSQIVICWQNGYLFMPFYCFPFHILFP